MAITKYTKSTLLDDEHIIYAARLHRFMFFVGAGFIALGIFFLFPTKGMAERPTGEIWNWIWYGVDYTVYYYNKFVSALPDFVRDIFIAVQGLRQNVLGLIFFMIGLFNILGGLVKYISIEQVITTHKIIYKKGFFEVNEIEIPLRHIEGIRVKQTALDRVIGRGRILITGMGMEHIEIKHIADPNHFRQEAYRAIDVDKNKNTSGR